MQYRLLQVLMLFAPAAVLAQTPSKVLVATGNEVITSIVSPGTIACLGGSPLTDPQGPPCSPGTARILISSRNELHSYQQLSGPAAPLFQGGTVNGVMHMNVDGTYYGHCWGHFVINVPGAGGQWEGSWSGVIDVLTNTISYTSTGYGYGGKLEGLQMIEEGISIGPGQPTVVILKVTRL